MSVCAVGGDGVAQDDLKKMTAAPRDILIRMVNNIFNDASLSKHQKFLLLALLKSERKEFANSGECVSLVGCVNGRRRVCMCRGPSPTIQK